VLEVYVPCAPDFFFIMHGSTRLKLDGERMWSGVLVVL
jgi:hypothetical protein